MPDWFLTLWSALSELYRNLCYAILGETISSIAARYGITHEMMLGTSIFLNVALGIVLIFTFLKMKKQRRDIDTRNIGLH